MKEPFLQNKHISLKLLFIGLLIIVSTLVFSALAYLLTKPLFGINIFSNPEILSNLKNINVIRALKFLQIINSFAIFLVPPVIYSFLSSNRPGHFLQVQRMPHIISLTGAALVMIFGLPLINWLAQMNSMMQFPSFMSGIEHWMKNSEQQSSDVITVFLSVGTVKGFIVNMVMMALLPAITEEIFFRGMLMRVLADWTKRVHLSIFISALLFSAIHMQFYGFIPRFLMGVFFGYLLIWSRSLWVPVFAHFINNSLAVVYAWLLNNKLAAADLDKTGTDSSDYFTLLFSVGSVAILIFAIYYFENREHFAYRMNKKGR